MDLLHTGKNRNQYVINKEAVEKAIPSIYNKPIIYRLNNEFIPDMATDVVEHGTTEDRTMRIAGVIPESAPMEFIQRNGKEYLRTRGVIYKIYQPSLANILQNRNGNMKVSIEIYVEDKEEDDEGAWVVNDFKFEGVALLGEGILEGIEGSQLNVIKFSAQDLNEHYMKFSTHEIPKSVKECVKNALKTREARGKGGSSRAVSIAKYLAGNDYIDYARLNYIKDYFNNTTNRNSLSFALFGGEASKEWLAKISNGKRVNNSMKNISIEMVRKHAREYLDSISENGWRYWVDDIYVEPRQLIVSDEQDDKIYLVEYVINDDGTIEFLWDDKSEILRGYVKADEISDNIILCKLKEVLSIDESGQLISNTHRLSSVDSAVAKKAELLLNSLEKEDEDMDEKKEEVKVEEEKTVVENSCDEKKENCDETEKNCGDTEKNCGNTKMNAEDEAEKVEDEEKKEDRDEDDKEEDDEKDFTAKLNALRKENEELKESLAVYKKQELVANMKALIEEFSYCFAADEKAELVKDLENKTFAEVENIVNENVRKFAKENKPEEDEEKKDAKFSIGLLANTFSYKKSEKKEARTLKDIKDEYSK